MSNWNPIETAPRDGTPVLITDGKNVDILKNFGNGWGELQESDDNFISWMPLPEIKTL
jgi:hypothetical protein